MKRYLLLGLIALLCTSTMLAKEQAVTKENALAEETVELVSKTVTTTEYGQLAALLGDEVNSIDVLTVNGPIDAADFHVMMEASFFGIS